MSRVVSAGVEAVAAGGWGQAASCSCAVAEVLGPLGPAPALPPGSLLLALGFLSVAVVDVAGMGFEPVVQSYCFQLKQYYFHGYIISWFVAIQITLKTGR